LRSALAAGLALLGAMTLIVGAASAAGPRSGARGRVVPASERLQLVFPLVADQAGLRRFAQQVVDPRSPSYGRYRSIAWLANHFGAPTPTRARVMTYLREHGASHVRLDATGLFVDATLPAATAERLFDTPLFSHEARSGERFIAPATRARLPSALRGAATGVIGLDTHAVAASPAVAEAASGYEPVSGTPTGCANGTKPGGFSPSEYLTAYGYDPLHAAGTLGQGERVALIEIDGFRGSDISTFAQCFGLRVPPLNGFGVGVSRPLAPGIESTLDLEVLTAAAPDLKAIDVYESHANASDVLQALTAPLQNSGYKPQVISVSLGLCEAFTLQAVGHEGINSTEAALEEAAASGISVLVATGDHGSAGCTNSSNPTAPPEATLAVNYPASSPWVTAVGGTNLVLNSENAIQSQTVWNDAGVEPGAAGGGGFSTLFPRPSYQAGTVGPNHRAIPDVALLADLAPGYDFYCTASPDCLSGSHPDAWSTVGGTSAATPLLAGGLALIDQSLRARKLEDLGLLNPLLYRIGRNASQAASTLDDVTQGSNDVGPFIPPSYRALGCCSATPGFDAASGWGGVNVGALAGIALKTQPKIVGVGVSLPRQRPLHNRYILAAVSCSGRCLLGAFAQVAVGNRRAFTAYSDLYRLSKPGRRAVRIKLTSAQVGRLRKAVRRHSKVTATVVGAIVDAGGNIERESARRQLRITG